MGAFELSSAKDRERNYILVLEIYADAEEPVSAVFRQELKIHFDHVYLYLSYLSTFSLFVLYF